jgi:hypothetical protein
VLRKVRSKLKTWRKVRFSLQYLIARPTLNFCPALFKNDPRPFSPLRPPTSQAPRTRGRQAPEPCAMIGPRVGRERTAADPRRAHASSQALCHDRKSKISNIGEGDCEIEIVLFLRSMADIREVLLGRWLTRLPTECHSPSQSLCDTGPWSGAIPTITVYVSFMHITLKA